MGIEYASGTRWVRYVSVASGNGTWRAEVRLADLPRREDAETIEVPGGPWNSEREALNAAFAYAFRRWPMGPGVHL